MLNYVDESVKTYSDITYNNNNNNNNNASNFYSTFQDTQRRLMIEQKQ